MGKSGKRSYRGKKSDKHYRGGTAPYVELDSYCNKNVDVSQYMAPCKHLDNIQSGYELKGGCGGDISHCLGQQYPSMGQMTGQTGAVSASELAWCYRNVYGATPSTNVLQKGGKSSSSSKKKDSKSKPSKCNKYKDGSKEKYECLELQRYGKMRKGGAKEDKSNKNNNSKKENKSKKKIECSATVKTNCIKKGGSYKKNKSSKSKKISRGGGYYLQVEKDTLGGLTRVGSRPEPIQPKTENYKIVSAFPRVNDTYNSVQYGGDNKVELGNFSHNMNTRAFNCNQPYWCADCI